MKQEMGRLDCLTCTFMFVPVESLGKEQQLLDASSAIRFDSIVIR